MSGHLLFPKQRGILLPLGIWEPRRWENMNYLSFLCQLFREIHVLSSNSCYFQCHTWSVHFFNMSVQGQVPNVFR